MMQDYLSITPEIEEAIKAGKPVVALESTILSHGMPFPQNMEFAHKVEEIVRAEGAIPATTAIIGGKLKVGLTSEEGIKKRRCRISCHRKDRSNNSCHNYDDCGNGRN